MSYDTIREQEQYTKARAQVTYDGELLYAGALLHYAARTYGSATALIYNDKHFSFIQLYRAACIGAELLKKKGVVPDDRVIICFENSPAFYVAYFAAWQAGAVVVPVNTFLTEYELRHIVTDAQPKVICTSEERAALFESFMIPVITPTESPLSLEHVSEQDIGQQELLLYQNRAFSEPYLQRNRDALCVLLYTSGTTGVPKGVMLSSRALITNILQVVARLQQLVGLGERVFAVLPLFHVFAQNTCVWTPMLTGCAVILVHKIDRRLVMHALKHKPTFFIGIPALYGMLCLLKTAPLDSVNYFVSGGDMLSDKIREAFALIYRRKICNGYGLTETSPVIAVDLNAYNGPTGLVGRPLLDVTCVIRDEQNIRMPNGSIGEIWVAGPHLMNGYYHEPLLTKHVLVNGFFRTGDLGYIDTQGNLVITGRLKDLIINKGFNIYPQEIENVLLSYPNVIAVGVVGVKDKEGTEVPVAFVQVRTPESSLEEALRALCKQRLAPYKIPHAFICSIEPLPTTSTGKVNKKLLRESYSLQVFVK